MNQKAILIILGLSLLVFFSCSIVLADEADFLAGSGGRVLLDGDILIGDRDDRIYGLEEENHSITATDFEVNFEEWDELASGDINNDGVDEIIHGDRSKDWIRIFNNNGTVLKDFDVGFEEGDDIETGDVNGDGIDEIVFADRDDFIRFFNMTNEISSFYLDFEDGDRIGVGDVNGDLSEEIIHGDIDDDYIRVYSYNGDLLSEFEKDFQTRDGLQTGDVNMDGVAEIVHADRSSDMTFIYDMEGNELNAFHLDYEIGDGWAVGDVNMDGVAEIVHADRSDDIRIYDMNGDLITEFSVNFEEGDGFTIGDTDNDSIFVSEPIHSEQTVADQILAIINAPPKHSGVIDDSGVFYATYENEVGQQTSQSLETTTDFAVSAKMSASYGGLFAKVKVSMSSKLSKQWENKVGSIFTQTIGQGLTADLNDRAILVTTHYDVYEFPIISPSYKAVIDGEQQYIMVVVPKAPSSVTLSDYDSSIHTQGDIRTYPRSMGELLGYESSNQLHNIEFYMSADPSSSWLELTQSQFESNKDTTSLKMSLGVSVSSGLPGIAKGKFSVRTDYGEQTVTTQKISQTEKKNIKVNYEGGITDENKTYTVRSVMYYDKETGIPIIDYIIPEMGSYYTTYNDTDNDTDQVTVLSIESTQISPNQEVQLPIKIINAEDIGSMDMTLTYNSSVLSASSLTAGAITSDSIFDHDIQPGMINISLVDDNGINGNGSIATITFNVIGEEGDTTSLVLSAIANDRQGAAIDMEITNGILSIEDSSPAPVKVTVSDTQGSNGSKVDVPIMITNAADVESMNITLTYDPTILQVESVTKGDLNHGIILLDMGTPGILSLAITDQNGITGDGEIAVISFTVVNKTGSSPLLIEDLFVYDVDSLEINATSQSGTFTITKSTGENGGTPGFEMVFLILSLIVVLFFTRKR